jgi:hypothetical protein
LVYAAGLFQTAGANGLQDAEDTYSINICRKLRRVETDLHVALSCEVVYLVRLYGTDDLNESHGVTHISIVQVEMRLAFEVSDALTEVNRTAAYNAMYFVALFEKELTEV